VLFKQFVDDDLGCASYLVGDEETGQAVVVDPGYAIEPYLEEAKRQKVDITRVLETHTHADHVSGHGRFALELGLPVAIHPAAEPAYEFEPLEDGGEVTLGRVTIRVVHTPGHRPEHCAFAVVDGSRGDEPWLTLTGDSLFIGDAARPDLAVEAREGARGLFHSLHRLLELHDGVEVYPGHVAGSLCGAGMSSKASSTIGFERRYNHKLTLSTEEEFVAESAGNGALRPPNMDRIVAVNRGPFVGAPAELERLSSAEGSVLLDVRSKHAFAAGHAQGAINVPIAGSQFPTRAAFVLDPDERIVLRGSPAEVERAARGLRAVGFLELGGYLPEADDSETFDPVDLEELERLLASGDVQLLDVREKQERDESYIPESRHIPYRRVGDFADELGGDGTVVTICETGARASLAASILAGKGVPVRPVVEGGVPDWEAAGKSTASFRRCGS
jgi:glyoxylase-like metal-dependent hydrolase (beta-lactamase superfamily II)/rhodanese-related sulfurtransferase